MDSNAKIYIAGHRGLVGSALVRDLEARGYKNLLLRSHAELDLTNQHATETFFKQEKPDYVFLAASKVGGILANSTYPAEFIRDNLAIQTNVIHAAWLNKVKRLMFLGSSCIYPRDCPQPIKEEYLLTGPLESSNRAYALAKIAGIEMCWSYNRQYRTQYLAVMPTNLYGPDDNYDLNTSHVIPALIRKFHEAKVRGDKQVVVWGSGTPRREFLYSDDIADACVFLMRLPDRDYENLLGNDISEAGIFNPPLVNIGCSEDLTIRDLALAIQGIVGFDGEIAFDASKPDGTPRKLMDISKLAARGWQPRVDLKTGIGLSYKAYLDQKGAKK